MKKIAFIFAARQRFPHFCVPKGQFVFTFAVVKEPAPPQIGR